MCRFGAKDLARVPRSSLRVARVNLSNERPICPYLTPDGPRYDDQTSDSCPNTTQTFPTCSDIGNRDLRGTHCTISRSNRCYRNSIIVTKVFDQCRTTNVTATFIRPARRLHFNRYSSSQVIRLSIYCGQVDAKMSPI